MGNTLGMARKPVGMRFERWTERLIREGIEAGEFDKLAGHGQPLPDIDTHDHDWWLRRKLKREQVQIEVPQLAIRDELRAVRARIAALDSETEVREAVEALNAKIRHINRTVVSGPPTTVSPLDVEETLAGWRATQRPDTAT
jgi:hypothetical protein